MHASFIALSALFCSNVFFLSDLDSHAIIGGRSSVDELATAVGIARAIR